MATRKPARIFAGIGVGLLILWLLFMSRTAPAAVGLRMADWKGTGLLRNNKPGDVINDVFNASLGFEKIFVVGLPERTDRRDGIVLQAAFSDLEFEFIDGISGEKVADKAIPKTTEHDRLDNGAIGCWRAHMNALQEVVRRNLGSALILEDDADWDVRIRQQLYDMALSSQALIQPLAGTTNSFADKTYRPPPEGPPKGVPEFPINRLPKTVPATVTPYGDMWDLIWVGHCGMRMPPADSPVPRGRVVSVNDESVPEKRYLWSLAPPFTLKDEYPDHTRVVHHAQEGVCTLGYAVTQRGARALLQEVALKDVGDPVDILLRFYCEGGKGRRNHNCLAIQPALFNHHRTEGPRSAMSNIGSHEGWQDKPSTDMTRWSVRLNVERLLDGQEMWDQLPNQNPA
ncbi:unnamed protein product [Clonostachys rhizophaga]|uniref:Glycosyl transferase family 25 domain-containing protein n=1 Tax=Clonostachys rhizophaga TaxID=160324 RepID=A0A9N9V2G5_9HYPO|nr:unnamed protein product [Clonostachys rhizophaga]